jgi:hypothetical protein
LALLWCHMHNAHLFLQSQPLPHKEQALSHAMLAINQLDCRHFWIIINCYLLLLLAWVLLNHTKHIILGRCSTSFWAIIFTCQSMDSVISCFFILRATKQSAAISLCIFEHPQNCERLSHVCSSVCLTVHPSVRIQLSFCTDFHEIWYVSVFRKSVEKIQVTLKSD